MNTSTQLRLALAANSTASSFGTKVPTTTYPSANLGFQDLNALYLTQQSHSPNYLHVTPFATAADGVTFAMRIWGWSKVFAASKWVPTLLAQLAVVAGNIAQGDANTFMGDTITVTYGGDDVNPISPAADVPAYATLHLRGHSLIEFDFSIAGGSATAMNSYWKTMNEIR
jgi:hypothetical protein